MDSASVDGAVVPDFSCPACRRPVIRHSAAYRCPACRREYPIVLDIADFRLSPDPYIPFHEEYEKARRLAEEAQRASFEDLIRFYWDITPGVTGPDAARYIRYALNGEARGEACLEVLEAHLGHTWAGRACLEIGCGTGGFLVAARHRFGALIGTDVALRWLVIARKRLAEVRGPIVLVCCSAEAIPFPDGRFDTIVGIHAIEHAANQQAVLSEAARVLKRGGLCFLSTPNRFSLGPEPCVRVWGVGFLPRSLASRYVRMMKGTPYRHIRLLSATELRRCLARAGFQTWIISAPRIAECDQRVVSPVTRMLIRVYHALRELPIFRLLLRVFGPFLQVVAWR